MKTKFLYLTTAMILTTFLIGCKKEQPSGQSMDPRSSPENMKISSLINAFHARMKSNLKFNDNVPADSAEWYLGAAVNSQFGDAAAKGLNMSIDSVFFSLYIENEHVAMEDMSEVFEEIIDSLTQKYYSIEGNDRHLLAVIVKNTEETEDEIKLKVTSIIMYDPFINDFWDFGENDYWKWWNEGGNYGGYCAGLYQGTATESDAAIQIRQSVTFRKPIPTGYFCYIPPFDEVYIYPTNYGNPNSPPSYYMYWYNETDPNFHTCLGPDEMNFYLLGAEHIVYTADNAATCPGARPPDLSFIELELSGDIQFGSLGNPDIYLHRGTGYYGTLFATGNLPDNL